jgi:hypothetical protein
MKKLYVLLAGLAAAISVSAQLRYDDGPIIEGNNFVIAGSWGRSNITFSFANGTADINGDDERNAVRQAFQIWADYTNLFFTEVTSGADIVISWGTGNHGDGTDNSFDGTNGTLAHAFFPPPNGSFAGDVHFDDDEIWSMDPQVFWFQPIDLVTVAAHEIGHALGLDHSDEACALMNPFYTGSHRYLAQDDIDGIRSLYGFRQIITTSNFSCSGGTLLVNNLPAGATVTWAGDNNTIATINTVNNEGIVSWSGNASGVVRFTATITLPCGTTVIAFIDCAMGIVTTASSGVQILGIPDNYQGCINSDFNVYTGVGGNFNWTVLGGQILYGQGTSEIRIQLDGAPNGFYIGVTETNACGTSTVLATKQGTIVECDGGGGGSTTTRVGPNPSRGHLMITSTVKNSFISQVQVRNKTGKVLISKKAGRETTQYSLDLSGLPDDVYLVEIFDGKRWNTHKVILNK